MNDLGTLYIVATPIGNMEDITLRALRVLKEVDYILCEDTRTTKNLLDRYDIFTKTMSYHAHTSNDKEKNIINLLKGGKNLALVSDAGTPCISDPGVMLVADVYKEFSGQVKIVPIPGPSALVTALSGSGVSGSDFVFMGFLPHKKGREKLFREISLAERVVVFYESPHRILKALNSLDKYVPKAEITIARELTKQFEEYIKGTAGEILKFLNENIEKQKGEFVVIVKPK